MADHERGVGLVGFLGFCEREKEKNIYIYRGNRKKNPLLPLPVRVRGRKGPIVLFKTAPF
jgi:hypothetical protein